MNKSYFTATNLKKFLVIFIPILGLISIVAVLFYQNHKITLAQDWNNNQNLVIAELKQSIKELKPQDPNTKYLEIKELGIKLELNQYTSDAYYVYYESTQESPNKSVKLSSQSLRSTLPSCAAEQDGITTLSLTDEAEYAKSASPENNLYIEKIGDQYIKTSTEHSCKPAGINNSTSNNDIDKYFRFSAELYSKLLPL